jgi:glycerol-3-phosphate dehydrogenase
VSSDGLGNPFDRDHMLGQLVENEFDVLVIGGGITGAGVALDAATRGLRTALVERDDFASGTSSKSSKLVHGGLRYLQQGDVRLVYQALHERQRLLRNAPHLVSVLPFLVPVLTKDGPVSKKIAKAMRSALWMYDVTGGARIGKRHRRLSAEQALAHCPTLPVERLSSAFVYYDASTDDARLTLTIARTAAAHGAVVANRCAVTELTSGPDGQVNGAVVDTGAGRITVKARAVVSAAGVWADAVRALEGDTDHEATLRPAKGVHVTLPWRLIRNDIAVIISVPGDKRSLFVVPWDPRPDGTFGHCYVGTTDTDYEGDLDHPQTTDDDVEYILRALNHAFGAHIGRSDVTATWAGLRPLVKAAERGRTADLSRRHSITTSPGGLVTVTGGKLTTYRQMAADTVDAVQRRLGDRGRCRTQRLRLLGGDERGRPPADHPDARLRARYGSELAEVKALVALDADLGRPLVPGLPYLRAEAVYGVRREMATTLVDVLTRRTRAHLLDRTACLAAAESVAALMAPELRWSTTEQEAQVAAYRALCDAERRCEGTAAARPEVDA